MTSDIQLLDLITNQSALSIPSGQFIGADFSGAQLQGLKLACFSLRGVILDGADLTGARLIQVDLSGASLREARLDRTVFQLVNAAGASFTKAQCKRAFWEQVNLSGTDLAGANLRETMLRGCNFERSRLDDAELSRSKLIYSNCGDASFRNASLMWANTVGSSFMQADFVGAKNFFLCREILIEILQHSIDKDFEIAKLVGAIATGSKWCYPEWKELLKSQPHYQALALKIFQRYPQSGFIEALQDGWQPATSVDRGADEGNEGNR